VIQTTFFPSPRNSYFMISLASLCFMTPFLPAQVLPAAPTNLAVEYLTTPVWLVLEAEFTWDHAYCLDCPYLDCDWDCAEEYASWLGDGICDDGSWGVDFNCYNWSFDEGDCRPAECADTPEIYDGECYLEVTALDAYCCQVEWDNICQIRYDACLSSNRGVATRSALSGLNSSSRDRDGYFQVDLILGDNIYSFETTGCTLGIEFTDFWETFGIIVSAVSDEGLISMPSDTLWTACEGLPNPPCAAPVNVTVEQVDNSLILGWIMPFESRPEDPNTANDIPSNDPFLPGADRDRMYMFGVSQFLCPHGYLQDCNGRCIAKEECEAFWGMTCGDAAGDGICDNGQYGLNFDCEMFEWDLYDCHTDDSIDLKAVVPDSCFTEGGGSWLSTGAETASFDLKPACFQVETWCPVNRDMAAEMVCIADVDCGCDPGDLTCDGTLDIMDIVQMVDAILTDTDHFCTIEIGDLDSNWLLTVTDLVLLVEWVLDGIEP